MEAPLLASTVAGSSTEVGNFGVSSTSSTTTTTSSLSPDDDSRHGHFAVTSSSQTPKPMPGMSPPPLSLSPPADSPPKDAKSLNTRYLEDCPESESPGPRLRSSRMFKGKGRDAVSIEREAKKPIRLLDLPLDILKDIVKEVTHTNDLTSLALCHSALHRLAIPHIYSRFDIVWPESITHAEPRSGVDALTYGLATLVMAEEIFGEAPGQRRELLKKPNRFSLTGQRATETVVRRRRGNHYAQFTKKFSLGNGPADWVQEYLITKEGGKMLGTLVALAVARMRALETFIWDMPTGILRDVWLALASLGDRDDGHPCRLERVWVRWHDNTSGEGLDGMPRPPPLVAAHFPPIQGMTSVHGLRPPYSIILDRVEHPSFSVLPPMKSLSVLDIDELHYLDEMAVLIGRSIEKLRELRVGIARHAQGLKWASVWEGDSVVQVDQTYPTAGSITVGEKRLGGILGVLTGFVCDVRKPSLALPDRTRRKRANSRTAAVQMATAALTSPSVVDTVDAAEAEQDPALTTALPTSPVPAETPSTLFANTSSSGTAIDEEPALTSPIEVTSEDLPRTPKTAPSSPPLADVDQHPRLSHKLELESLELERVPISVPVLQIALDWTHLTSLTLLHCPNHEQLWKTLRRNFAPYPKSPTYPQPRRTPTTSPRKGKSAPSIQPSLPASDLIFPLRLKKVHTNTVSAALISFLKETLAPNSLEVLFLQETRSYASAVSIDAIFRGPLKRHRASLTRLLIDSSTEKETLPHTAGQAPPQPTSTRWRRWILPREVLTFVVGGKMPALRELGVGIEYRDWHFFLQHLPLVKGLRSLYLPFLADHVHGNVDPRELALQIVDIVALRPECEICYVGIASKCFEILERKKGVNGGFEGEGVATLFTGLSGMDEEEEEEEEPEEDGEGMGEEETESEVEEGEDGEENDDDNDDDDDDDGGDGHEDDSNSEAEDQPEESKAVDVGKLRLREILFYDDKVAVFKARHGRL